ncbi:hypothetical protein IEQ34_000443 [Dendrobium chrysotoxum]|uniref:Uncharacterized protein n=1 Tax=Dendrobium chrysotoxum TaxID=161865 RepID=A0AAV7HU06_DENCH|nr:hypothetical protein IEQ34_000443 [Dendrobium chrysotoxum]
MGVNDGRSTMAKSSTVSFLLLIIVVFLSAEMMVPTIEAQKTCSVILTPDSCNLPICRGRCFRMLRGASIPNLTTQTFVVNSLCVEQNHRSSINPMPSRFGTPLRYRVQCRNTVVHNTTTL